MDGVAINSSFGTNARCLKSERLGAYARTALGVLAVAGLVVTLAALPGLAVVMQAFVGYSPGRRYRTASMRQALLRLRKRGYIRVVPHGRELRLSITQKGLRSLKNRRKEAAPIVKPKKWDRRWRLVAFDIPEPLKTKRETFRNILIALGFRKLQKSLFVHPFPCEIEIKEFVEELRIGPYVHLIYASVFNGELELRKTFGLS